MILDEILPNALPPIIVNSTLQIARAISMEASLSFLGLGDLTVMSWGRMINAAILTFHQGWWTAFFPGLAIFLTVLGFNILGDGLNDALNPRLREQ
jgi:peptide/nickel transport system permease protein